MARGKAKRSRKAKPTSPSPEPVIRPSQAPRWNVASREPSAEVDQLASSQASQASDASSTSSSSSPSYSVTLPDAILLRLFKSLIDIDAHGTLSSLSLASKYTHDLASPILFRSITIRSHDQLAAVLSSLDVSDTASKKRATRLSGPKCDPTAKLVRFGLTTHLSINNFPSTTNLKTLKDLQDTFSDTTIFSSVDSVSLSRVFTQFFHPKTCGKRSSAPERYKRIHLLHILASPSHLILDLRGMDSDFIARPSGKTAHGCTCVYGFCAMLAEAWADTGELKRVTMHVDAPILSTHFFSTTAKGPVLNIIFSPPPSIPPPSSPPPAKKARRSKSPHSDSDTLDALAAYILNRVRQVSDHKGGKTVITVTRIAGEEESEDEEGANDGGALMERMVAKAKKMAGDKERGMFEGGKAKMMLKGITIEIKGGPAEEEA